MRNLRDTISFSSYTEEQYWHTYIDLKLETISITSEKQGSVYHGSIAEFKALELIKANYADKIYADILRMTEELIKMLTKKT